MIKARLRRDDGFALVAAMMVMFIFFALGLAVLATNDTQSRETRRERNRESAFQLAEGVLNSAIYRLSQQWPGTAGTAYPTPSCSAANASDSASPSTACPSVAYLKSTFGTKDFANWSSNVTWSVQVRDNGGPYRSYYNDAGITAQPSYDAAGDPATGGPDNKLWVRAQAKVRGKTRTLVALIRAEDLDSNFPSTKTLVAGYFTTTNSGKKVIVDNGTNGDVVVRCGTGTQAAPVPYTTTQNGCAEFPKVEQISPMRVTSQTDFPPALSPEALDAVRALAQSQGNYFQTCAQLLANPNKLAGDVPGEVVFVEDGGNLCTVQGNTDYNDIDHKGALVFAKGGLAMRGNAEFYGVVYFANQDNSNNILLDLGGNSAINGGALIDGPGGAYLGSSKTNLNFKDNPASGLKLFGTAGLVQNSFREIKPSS